MQLLRITRASNEASPVRVLWIIGFVLLAFVALGFATGSYGFFVCSVLLGYGLVRAVWWIRFPHELELVVEQDRIRYGRSDRPASQWSRSRGNVTSVCLEEDVHVPSLVVRRSWFSAHQIPGYLLSDLEQMRAVADAIREHWPEVAVRVKPAKASLVEHIALANGRGGYHFTIFWAGGIGGTVGTLAGAAVAGLLTVVMEDEKVLGLIVVLGAWLGFWWTGSFCRRRLQLLIRRGLGR